MISSKDKRLFHLSCDNRHNYTPDEDDVLQAVDRWKQENNKRFPSTIDIFRVIKSMGYQRILN